MSKSRISQSPQLENQLHLRLRSRVVGVLGLLFTSLLALVLLSPKEESAKGRLLGFHSRVKLSLNMVKAPVFCAYPAFPVLISVQDEQLKSVNFGGKVQHTLGYDLRFTAPDGATPLLFQVLHYDPEIGALQARVQLDTLRQGASCYLYFGNDQLSSRPAFNKEVYFWQGLFAGESDPTPPLSPGQKEEWRKWENYFLDHEGKVFDLGEVEVLPEAMPVDYALMESGVRGSAFVLISWASNQEEDNALFEVFRSQNGQTWESLKKVAGSRFSSDLLHYHVPDQQPFTGKNYYRIRQTCANGWFSYADILSATFHPEQKGIEVQHLDGNTFSDQLDIHFTTQQADVLHLELFNVSGNLVKEALYDAGTGPQIMEFKDLGDLLPQAYVLTITGKDRKPQVFRVTKE